MKRTRLLAAFTLAAACAVAAPDTAQAQPSGDDARQAMRAARTFAEKGFELFEAGEYVAAIAEFEHAEARFHAPPHLLYIARSRAALGRLVDSLDAYERIISEQLDNKAPKPFHAAQAEAVAEIEALRARIPAVRVVIRGAEPTEVTLTVNGEAQAEIPPSMSLDPGEYHFEAEAPGMAPASLTVDLDEGADRVVALELVPGASEPSPLFVPALVSFGAGGIALLIGTAAGISSLSKTSDIDEQCNGLQCPQSLEDEADTATAIGHLSTAMFVIGGAAVAAGVTLLLLDQQGEGDGDAASWRLRLGPGALGLEARF